LQRFAGRRRHWHRHVEAVRGVKTQIEILAQERRREGRRPVEIDQSVRLVAREDRAHHAVIDEVEKGVTRYAGLLRQNGDLGEILNDDAEADIMCDLANARQLALADIGDATRREGEDIGFDQLEGGFWTRGDRAELAGFDAFAVAADRGGYELHAL